MIAVVTASCLTAYAFYTLAPETVAKYRTERLALTSLRDLRDLPLSLPRPPEGAGGSPSEVLLTDWPCFVAVALWAGVVRADRVHGARGARPPGQ